MYSHHRESIKNISEKLKNNGDVLGLLVGGSIAHGFESEKSDVDIMIIISDENFNVRLQEGKTTYWETESCTYKDGYIDGKYICLDFMRKVAEFGSEPARFAFDGSITVFSKIPDLQELIDQIKRYPIEKKSENIRKFYGQFEAWRWYYYEAQKHKNEYLLNQAISNFILFGGRIILAHNETLYPYHKWFLRAVEKAENRPENIIKLIENVYSFKDKESIEEFYKSIKEFVPLETSDFSWSGQFMADTELSWMDGRVPISDI